MLYGTSKNDISILTHPHDPTTEVNGFRQVGQKVPVTAKNSITLTTPAKVFQTKSRPSNAALRATGKYGSSVTAVRNPDATNWQNDLISPETAQQLAVWGSTTTNTGRGEAPLDEGVDRDGYLSGFAARIRRSSRAYRPGLGFVGDDVTTTLDLDLLQSKPLDMSGTYHEGQVVDLLNRLHFLQESWIAGEVSDADFDRVSASLVKRMADLVGAISRGGSKPASIVNTFWGAAQAENFVKPINGQWVPQRPSKLNPPFRAPIVLPQPNKKSGFQKVVSNITPKNIVKAAIAPIVVPFESGVKAAAIPFKQGKKVDKLFDPVVTKDEQQIVNKVGVPVTYAVTAAAAVKAATGGNSAGAAAPSADASTGAVTAQASSVDPRFTRDAIAPEGIIPSDTRGYVPGGFVDAAKNTVQEGVDAAISDPLGFLKRKQAQIKKVTSDVNAAKDLVTGPSSPSAFDENGNLLTSTSSMVTHASAYLPALVAGGLVIALLMRKK